jgi:hypothetical protein
MDLLERYLQAVRKHLPWERQDDIVAELRANLEAQLEDRESELGRPLTKAETEAWLKEIGPPMKVAGRYQPQQYLIGPGMFPTYWYVIRLALTWAFVVYLIVTAVEIAMQPQGGGMESVVWAVLRLPGVLLTTAAWVTLVFAIVETMVTRWPGEFACLNLAALNAAGMDWNPAGLPAVDVAGQPGGKRKSFVEAVAGVIFQFVLLGWLLLFPHYPYLLMGPGAFLLKVSPFQVASSLVYFYWCVVVLNGLQLVWQSVELLRGTWQRSEPMERLAIKVVGLIPLLVLLNARDQVYGVLKHPAVDAARYGGMLHTINVSIYRGVQVIFAIVLLQVGWESGQMVIAAYRKRVAVAG